jgi:hypothetical protein
MTFTRLRWLAALAAVGAALTFLLASVALGGQSHRMTMAMPMTMPMRHNATLTPSAVALHETCASSGRTTSRGRA